MSSRELQLVSRIIGTGDIDTVTEWGITPDDFRTGVANSIFQYLVNYYRLPDSRGSVIGPYAAQHVFPTFALCDDRGMTTAALCAEVRKERIAIEINQRMEQIRQNLEFNPLECAAQLQLLGTEMVQLGSGKITDHFLGQGLTQQLYNYGQTKAGISNAVARWPWPPLQNATGGVDPDDYVVIYGRPKSFKSWVISYLTTEFFMQDKKIVIYTKEMSAETIFKRIIGCIARVPYQGLRMGRLTAEDEMELYNAQRLVAYMRAEDKIIVLSGKDAPSGGDNVPWLHSKINVYRPDIVVIDGLYLMSDHRKNKQPHEKVRSISNDLRQMNLETHVPILATLQANRGAAKHKEANFDELAFSDAIGQDATLVARVINEKDSSTAMLVLAGAREFDLNGFRINAVPAKNFSYFGEITAKDIERAKENDHGESDNPGAHVAGKKAAKKGGMTAEDAHKSVNQAITHYINDPNGAPPTPFKGSTPSAFQAIPQQYNFYSPPPPLSNGR